MLSYIYFLGKGLLPVVYKTSKAALENVYRDSTFNCFLHKHVLQFKMGQFVFTHLHNYTLLLKTCFQTETC